MAAIVYDGVEGNGTLFSGIKFCILQRVPDRKRWLDLVKTNGGEIVILEKQADIVIADHARKGNPPGSISWRWIEWSVKEGRLEDKADHRAAPEEHSVRAVASGKPVKKSRTPFTPEDDKVLMDWVVRAERKGLSTKGNEIYDQLEQQNTRHTSQSWRDRWVKYVSHYPRPDVSREASSSPPAVVARPSTQKPKRHATEAATRRSPRSGAGSSLRPSSVMPASTPSKKTPWIAKSARGKVFTAEEDQLLRDYFDDIQNIDEDEELNAWAAWSVENPDHTPQEWRNQFKKIKSMLLPAAERVSNEDASNSKQGQKAMPSARLEDSRSSIPSDVRLEETIIQDEKVFRHNLNAISEDYDHEITFKTTICGKNISLFALWQIVKKEFGGFGSEESENSQYWLKVAQKLNFPPSQHPEASELLHAFYDSNLLPDLEDFIKIYTKEADSQERAMIELQLKESLAASGTAVDDSAKEEGLTLSPVIEKQSKSNLPGKRVIEDENIFRPHSSHNKRQRIGNSQEDVEEVPATPEDIVSNKKLPRRILQPSPLKRVAAVKSPVLGEPEDDEDEEDLDDGKSNRLVSPLPINFLKQPDISGDASLHGHGEPETQDFAYSQIPKSSGNHIARSPTPLPPRPARRTEVPETQELAHSHTPKLSVNRMTPHSPLRVRSTGRTEVPETQYFAQSQIREPSANRSVGSTSSSPPQPSRLEAHDGVSDNSPAKSHTESEKEALISDYMERHETSGHQKIAIMSLLATTIELELAEKLIEKLKEGSDIPDDVAGVWTSVDDEAARSENREDYIRIVKKHGRERVALRQKFLAEQDEDGDDSE